MADKYLKMTPTELSKEYSSVKAEYEKCLSDLRFFKSYEELLPSLDSDTTCFRDGVVFKFIDARTLKYRVYNRENEQWTGWQELNIGDKQQFSYKYSFDNVKIIHIPLSDYYHDANFFHGSNHEESMRKMLENHEFSYSNPYQWLFYSQESKNLEDEYLREMRVPDNEMKDRHSHWYYLYCNVDKERLKRGMQPFDLVEWRMRDSPYLFTNREEAFDSIAHNICYRSPFTKDYVKMSDPEQYKDNLRRIVETGVIPEEFCNMPVDQCEFADATFTPVQGVSYLNKVLVYLNEKAKKLEETANLLKVYTSYSPEELQKKKDQQQKEIKDKKKAKESFEKKKSTISSISTWWLIINFLSICFTPLLIDELSIDVYDCWWIVAIIIISIVLRRVIIKSIRKKNGIKE